MKLAVVILLICLSSLSAWPLNSDEEEMMREEAEFFATHKLRYWKRAVKSHDWERLSKLTTSAVHPLEEAQENTNKVFDKTDKILGLIRKLVDTKSFPFLRMRILQLILTAVDMTTDHVTYYKLEGVKNWLHLRSEVSHVKYNEWHEARISVAAAQREFQDLMDTIRLNVDIIKNETSHLEHSDEEKVRSAADRIAIVFNGSRQDILDEIEWSRFYLQRLAYLWGQEASLKPTLRTTESDGTTLKAP